ncbi:4'-phosphopantetheinyl transferase [Streptomyces sp. NPDC021093]|uniref:4'-phosphopantetheinyl transferase n=1 Tax=Streptomyces sp. NPDC021093 TaxID=3365112 RepID=UPI00378B56B8
MSLLGPLLPSCVRVAESFGDPAAVFLFPEEEKAVERATDRRRREFATVRHCAHRALTALGRTAEPLVPGPAGEPRWPPTVVGSMTHCEGYRAAAVARGAEVDSLGIDAEPHAPVSAGLLARTALPRERRLVAQLTDHAPHMHWDRLLFSAKESVYKAWYPLTGQWLGFTEAELDISPTTGTFRARLLRFGQGSAGEPLDVFHGRWNITHGLVLTAVAHLPGLRPAWNTEIPAEHKDQ